MVHSVRRLHGSDKWKDESDDLSDVRNIDHCD